MKFINASILFCLVVAVVGIIALLELTGTTHGTMSFNQWLTDTMGGHVLFVAGIVVFLIGLIRAVAAGINPKSK